jgi:hypothetical protein
MTDQQKKKILTSHLLSLQMTKVNIAISSESLGVLIVEQDDKVIIKKKKVESSEQSGVCPEIKAANIPSGACLSFINNTRIVSITQAAKILRTSPRPITFSFEFPK